MMLRDAGQNTPDGPTNQRQTRGGPGVDILPPTQTFLRANEEK